MENSSIFKIQNNIRWKKNLNCRFSNKKRISIVGGDDVAEKSARSKTEWRGNVHWPRGEKGVFSSRLEFHGDSSGIRQRAGYPVWEVGVSMRQPGNEWLNRISCRRLFLSWILDFSVFDSRATVVHVWITSVKARRMHPTKRIRLFITVQTCN